MVYRVELGMKAIRAGRAQVLGTGRLDWERVNARAKLATTNGQQF
jgi:hypothetical protein